jgi:hypothetical protein
MWGKSEHLTLKKKNPTSSLKTYLLGLETGSRIFGTTISAKKTAKMQRLIILKQLGKILGVRIYPILRYGFRIWDPRSGIWKKTYSGSRVQGSKRHRIRIRNTGNIQYVIWILAARESFSVCQVRTSFSQS